MGRQKVYINALKNNNYEDLESSIKNNIFRNTNFDLELFIV